MSEFSDFMTMKLIEQRRLEQGITSNKVNDLLFENMNMNKNINVRTRIDLISKIEVLAEFFNLSKAELVTEMLDSSVREAMFMIEKEGWLDSYLKSHYKNLETQYGIVAKDHDENGNPITFSIPSADNKEL